MPEKQEPMTYRQLRDYAERQGWDFSVGGFESDLVKRGVRPSGADDDMPPRVEYWLNEEVHPEVSDTGYYQWPKDLDATQRIFDPATLTFPESADGPDDALKREP